MVLVRVQLSGRESHAKQLQTAKCKPNSTAGEAIPISGQGSQRPQKHRLLSTGNRRPPKPGVGKQRDNQQGSQGSRMDTGAPRCAEEAGAKRVSPSVNSACTRQPLPGVLSRLLTPSEQGSSPLLWPEEYRLTYSPSPASSLAFSL